MKAIQRDSSSAHTGTGSQYQYERDDVLGADYEGGPIAAGAGKGLLQGTPIRRDKNVSCVRRLSHLCLPTTGALAPMRRTYLPATNDD